jgi:hypothetical protein
MSEKRPGDPCPKCVTPLHKARSRFRSIPGHVAECAHCGAAYELAGEAKDVIEQPQASRYGWRLSPI